MWDMEFASKSEMRIGFLTDSLHKTGNSSLTFFVTWRYMKVTLRYSYPFKSRHVNGRNAMSKCDLAASEFLWKTGNFLRSIEKYEIYNKSSNRKYDRNQQARKLYRMDHI